MRLTAYLKGVSLAVMLAVTACANLPFQNELTSACQFYVTVAAITAWIPGAAAITQALDPICRLVLAGQPAPAGVTAEYIRSETFKLEQLEEAAPHGR